MKISIVTITYNSAATLRDTLESVQSQTYTNIEQVVADGASTDGTIEIVKEFGVENFKSEKDSGLYDAMNKGVSMATGDVVGILNSDDFYYDNDVLKNVAKEFEDPSVQAVYGDLYYVDPVDTSKVVRKWISGPFKKSRFLNGWMPPHPTFFVRREVYEKYGLFNLELRSAADYEIMLRYLYKHELKVNYINKFFVRMRAGGMSNASLSNRIRANKEDRRAWEINGIKPRFYTLYLKPLSKIHQFLFK